MKDRSSVLWRWAVVLVIAMASPVSADQIELKSGKVYKGLVVKQTPAAVTFQVYLPAGGKMVRVWPRRKIEDLIVDGVEPVFETREEPKAEAKDDSPAKPADEAKPAAKAGKDGKVYRSRQEIDMMINYAGRTKPDWWDAVELTYPETMDLSGKKQVKGWRPDVKIDTYIWSKVNPRPSNWRNGAKLMHHVVEFRKGDPKGQAKAYRQLANIYFQLLNDWPRAAFYYRKVLGPNKPVNVNAIVNTAACYYYLGSPAMAKSALKMYRMDERRPFPQAIKLWVEMGDVNQAMKMAERLMKHPRSADVGYLAAGNAQRYIGNIDEAIGHYEKVVAMKSGSRHFKLNHKRATGSLAACKLLKTLDVSKVPYGTYTGESIGYRGPVGVEVSVEEGKMTKVKVVKTKEDVFYTSLTAVPSQIVERQSFTRIEGITGATTTSDAIVNATVQALHPAMEE